MRRVDVLPGTIFGRLTVVEETTTPGRPRAMLCRCECGTEKVVELSNLRSGNSKSCGCHGTAPNWTNLHPGEIPLFGKKARGRVALVDPEDYGLVTGYRWHVREADPEAPGRRPNGPYAVSNIYLGGGKSRTITMHALIMGRPYIDHENHNTLDNRRSNLRPATPAQNGANARKNPGKTSRYKGVFWDRQKVGWVAKVNPDDSPRYLGVFANEEDAGLAYDVAACEVFGEFAKLNFSYESAADMEARWQALCGARAAEEWDLRSARMAEWWKDRPPASHTCTVCGVEFESRANVARVLYCSGACKNRKYLQRLRGQEGRLF